MDFIQAVTNEMQETPVCLFIYLYVCLFECLYICMFIYIFVYIYIIYMFVSQVEFHPSTLDDFFSVLFLNLEFTLSVLTGQAVMLR